MNNAKDFDPVVSESASPATASKTSRLKIAGRILCVLITLILVGFLLQVLSTVNTARNNMRDMSNLREINSAMRYYAADNGDLLPGHPREVKTYAGGFPISQDFFISPLHRSNTTLERGDSDGVAVRYGSYVFLLPGVSLDDIDSPDNAVLVYTAKASDNQSQRNVLFVDGHGKRMEEQGFRALLPPEVDVDALDGP